MCEFIYMHNLTPDEKQYTRSFIDILVRAYDFPFSQLIYTDGYRYACQLTNRTYDAIKRNKDINRLKGLQDMVEKMLMVERTIQILYIIRLHSTLPVLDIYPIESPRE